MIKITPLDEWIHKKINGEGSCLGKADLEAYQLDKLNWTLSYVRKHSPFYRQHLAGLPDQIHALAELNQFPLSGADDLRREPLAFVCVPQDQIHRIVTLQTSGTTGQPKRVFFTAEDQDLTIDFFGVGMSVLTEPDERVLILLPGERPGSVGELLSRGLTRAGKVPVAHGPVVDPLLTLERMEQAGIDCLVGAPVQVLSLAEHWQPGKRKPRTVLLSTDYVPNAIVHRIEETWGCEVFNHYGTTEMGLGGGVECSAHRGYHLREADLYFELIDPKSGFPAAKGEDGEVVFTTLTRQGMPLFRYRMDDLSRFLPEYCPCGTSLRTLEKPGSTQARSLPVTLLTRPVRRLCAPGWEVRSRANITTPTAIIDRARSTPSFPDILGTSGSDTIREHVTMKRVSRTSPRPADAVETPDCLERPTLPTAAQTFPGMYFPSSETKWIE